MSFESERVLAFVMHDARGVVALVQELEDTGQDFWLSGRGSVS